MIMKTFNINKIVFFCLSIINYYHVYGHQIINRKSVHPFGVVQGDCQLCPNSNVYCSGCQYCPDGSLCANANCDKPDPPGPSQCQNAWDFSDKTGPLDHCTQFSNADSSLSIKACGYDISKNPRKLFGLGSSAGGHGLGLCRADGSVGDDKGIDPSTFVQLDMQPVFDANANAVNGRFMLDGLESKNQWVLYGSNEKGELGTPLASGSDVMRLDQVPRYGHFRYLSFTAATGSVSLYFFYSNCPIDAPSLAPVPAPVTTFSPSFEPSTSTCTLQWNFAEVGGPLFPCHVYDPSEGEIIITACGYDLAGNQVDLYGKAGDLSSNEVGLGVSSDPSSQNEIWTDGFLQLDLQALLSMKPVPSNAKITITSVSGSDSWKIYGSAHPASIGTLLATGNANGDVLIPAFGSYAYLNVIAGAGNVLLQGLKIDCPEVVPTPVPSPAPSPSQPRTYRPTNEGDCANPRTWLFHDKDGNGEHSFLWNAEEDGGQSHLSAYAFAIDGRPADLSAIHNGGLGVYDSGALQGFQLSSDFYISFKVSTWTSDAQSLVLQIGGFGEFAVYGSEHTGDVLSNYILLYHGPPDTYTLQTHAYKYISVTAVSGLLRIHQVALTCAIVPHTRKPVQYPTVRPTPIGSSAPSPASSPVWVSDSPALSYMPTPSGLCDHTWDFQELQGSLGYTASFAARGSNSQLTAYAYLNNGSLADLYANSLGLGIFNPYSSNGHHITSTKNLEFDVSAFASAIIEIDYQGYGNLLVYGSNQSGIGAGNPMQVLLYDGSPRPFSCAYCSNRFITATMAFGLAHVKEFHVRAPCAPSAAPVLSPLPLAPSQVASDSPAAKPHPLPKCSHSWSFNETAFIGHSIQYKNGNQGLSLPLAGFRSDGSSADLVNFGLGIGISGTQNNTIDSQSFVELDLDAYQGKSTAVVTSSFPGTTADVLLYGSTQSGSRLGSVAKVLLFKGPAGAFVLTSTYRYLSVTCAPGSRAYLEDVSVGCAEDNGLLSPQSSSSLSSGLSYQNTVIVAVICAIMCVFCLCIAAHCYSHKKKEEDFASPRSSLDWSDALGFRLSEGAPADGAEPNADNIINPGKEERGRSNSWFGNQAPGQTRGRTRSWADMFSPAFSSRNTSPRGNQSVRSRGGSTADFGMSPTKFAQEKPPSSVDSRSQARAQTWGNLFSPALSVGAFSSGHNSARSSKGNLSGRSGKGNLSDRSRGESQADMVGMSPRQMQSDS